MIQCGVSAPCVRHTVPFKNEREVARASVRVSKPECSLLAGLTHTLAGVCSQGVVMTLLQNV